jgi:hypothetical protein
VLLLQVVRRELCSVLSRGTRTYCFLDSLLTAPDGSPASAAWVLAIVELPIAAASTASATASAATGTNTSYAMLTIHMYIQCWCCLVSASSVHLIPVAVAVSLCCCCGCRSTHYAVLTLVLEHRQCTESYTLTQPTATLQQHCIVSSIDVEH